MSYNFPGINSILYGHLKPSRHFFNVPDKFREMNSAFLPVSLEYKTEWEVKQIKALTPVTIYYKAVIDAEMNACYNLAVKNWLMTNDSDEKIYLSDNLLNKTLKPLLSNLNDVIQERYQLEYNKFTGRNEARMHDEAGFIMQYLKLNLIALFMNLQSRFEGFLHEAHLTQEDLLMLFFGEEESGPGAIEVKPKNHQPIEAAFTTDNHKEIRVPDLAAHAGNDALMEILVKKDLYNEVVGRLKQYLILDENGKYIKSKKQHNSRLIAVVCEEIINSGMLRKNIPGEKTKLRQHEVLRIIGDHFSYPQLYATFKKLTPVIREDASLRLPWLDTLFRKH